MYIVFQSEPQSIRPTKNIDRRFLVFVLVRRRQPLEFLCPVFANNSKYRNDKLVRAEGGLVGDVEGNTTTALPLPLVKSRFESSR